MEEVLNRLKDWKYENTAFPKARIEGLNALLVWQYVRFNPLFRKEFDILCDDMRAIKAEDKEEIVEIKSEFKRRWLIRGPLPSSYDDAGLPEETCFSFKPISVLGKRNIPGADKYIRQQIEGNRRFGYESVIEIETLKLECFPTLNKLRFLEEVGRKYDQYLKKIEPILGVIEFQPIIGKQASKLASYVACYYFRVILKEKHTVVSSQHYEIFGKEIQDGDINDRVIYFEKFSRHAPLIFFCSPVRN